jgi:hypothetical protein
LPPHPPPFPLFAFAGQHQVRDLFPAMARLAGLPQDTPLTVFEEIKWEPTVMVSLLPPNQVCH